MREFMKRIILALLVLLMASSLSSRIMVQTKFSWLGNNFEYHHDCFRLEVDKLYYNFSIFEGAEVSIGYELFSDNVDNKFHFFAGADVGLFSEYMLSGYFAGLNFHLFDTDFFRYELMTTLHAGQLEFFKGPSYNFGRIDLDFVMSKKNRRLPYLGLGISNVNTINVDIFRDYGYDLYFVDNLSLHVMAGFRL